MGKLKQHLPPGVSPENDLFLAMFLIRLPPSMREVVGAGTQLTAAAMVKAPAPSPSESGHGTRSSMSAPSSPVWPRTPSLAACVAAADHRVCAQAVLPQPSRSRFQTRWFLHLPLRRHLETVLEPFSYQARRFLHARDRWHHHRFHRSGTHPVNGHATEVRPLTSSPSS
jgi:hypothetical protein